MDSGDTIGDGQNHMYTLLCILQLLILVGDKTEITNGMVVQVTCLVPLRDGGRVLLNWRQFTKTASNYSF